MAYILEPKPNPPETSSADTGSKELVKRLFKESIRPYLKWIILSLICMAGVAAATAASAWLMKPVINEVFVAKNETLLFPISLAVIFTFVVKGLSNYGQSVSISYVGQRIVTDTQHRLYEHLIEMELGFFQRSSTGSLLSLSLIHI